jgi:myo-inositol-1(or 4)-monophosphatase
VSTQPTSSAGTSELVALATDVAREAGAGLRTAFGRLGEGGLAIHAKSTPTDLVSEADVATERLIRARLEAARPDDAIMGEEGDDRPGTSGLRWVVDPLDGTVNFLFGLPQWCVSVAVEDAEGTLAGVVFDPMRDETWAATRDGSATLNEAPLGSPARTDLATALVATGFGYDAGVREAQARVLARLLPRVRDVRRLGAAALDLVWAAGGRVDAYYERGVHHWDVAAGALICARAGLAVRELTPAPPAASGLLVAPPAFADELVALVTD